MLYSKMLYAFTRDPVEPVNLCMIRTIPATYALVLLGSGLAAALYITTGSYIAALFGKTLSVDDVA